EICEGQTATLTASGGSSYLWSTTETTVSISDSPISNSIYFVIASNSCGNDTASINVIVNTLPIANAGMDHTIILGNSTTLNGSGGINYSWSPSSGLDCSNCPVPAANPLITTSYIVTDTDANGCQSSDMVV